MAYVVLVINCPNDSIAQLNPVQEPTKARESIENCEDLLQAIKGGNKAASVQVTVRSTDPAVATAGSGSTQNTYSQL